MQDIEKATQQQLNEDVRLGLMAEVRPARPNPYMSASKDEPSIEAISAEILELHTRGDEQRKLLNHPPAEPVEPLLARYTAKHAPASNQVALQALLKLREQKAVELMMLALRNCGRSALGRNVGGGSKAAGYKRFSLPALLATVEAMFPCF